MFKETKILDPTRLATTTKEKIRRIPKNPSVNKSCNKTNCLNED
jgi:hypothetical protein